MMTQTLLMSCCIAGCFIGAAMIAYHKLQCQLNEVDQHFDSLYSENKRQKIEIISLKREVTRLRNKVNGTNGKDLDE